MTETRGAETGEGWTIDRWRDGRTTLTAAGNEPAAVLAAGLAGILAIYRGDGERSSTADATTALAIRGEGTDVAGLFASLAASLFEEVDHEAYDVLTVRFDGMVRTDEGLAGWGYALSVPGSGRRRALAVEDVVTSDGDDGLTFRATIRRAG